MRSLTALALVLAAAPALAAPPKVMTDIPAVHALAAGVMGDLGTPGILLDQGADAHHFQLRPSQAKALSQADLLLWIGPRMTPWLERVGVPGHSESHVRTAASPPHHKDLRRAQESPPSIHLQIHLQP